MTFDYSNCPPGRNRHDWDYFKGGLRMCVRCDVFSRWVEENHRWEQFIPEGPSSTPPTFMEEIAGLTGDLLWEGDLHTTTAKSGPVYGQPTLQETERARAEECLRIHERLMDILARHAYTDPERRTR